MSGCVSLGLVLLALVAAFGAGRWRVRWWCRLRLVRRRGLAGIVRGPLARRGLIGEGSASASWCSARSGGPSPLRRVSSTPERGASSGVGYKGRPGRRWT
jgi:hypothetical protein